MSMSKSRRSWLLFRAANRALKEVAKEMRKKEVKSKRDDRRRGEEEGETDLKKIDVEKEEKRDGGPRIGKLVEKVTPRKGTPFLRVDGGLGKQVPQFAPAQSRCRCTYARRSDSHCLAAGSNLRGISEASRSVFGSCLASRDRRDSISSDPAPGRFPERETANFPDQSNRCPYSLFNVLFVGLLSSILPPIIIQCMELIEFLLQTDFQKSIGKLRARIPGVLYSLIEQIAGSERLQWYLRELLGSLDQVLTAPMAGDQKDRSVIHEPIRDGGRNRDYPGLALLLGNGCRSHEGSERASFLSETGADRKTYFFKFASLSTS